MLERHDYRVRERGKQGAWQGYCEHITTAALAKLAKLRVHLSSSNIPVHSFCTLPRPILRVLPPFHTPE